MARALRWTGEPPSDFSCMATMTGCLLQADYRRIDKERISSTDRETRGKREASKGYSRRTMDGNDSGDTACPMRCMAGRRYEFCA